MKSDMGYDMIAAWNQSTVNAAAKSSSKALREACVTFESGHVSALTHAKSTSRQASTSTGRIASVLIWLIQGQRRLCSSQDTSLFHWSFTSASTACPAPSSIDAGNRCASDAPIPTCVSSRTGADAAYESSGIPSIRSKLTCTTLFSRMLHCMANATRRLTASTTMVTTHPLIAAGQLCRSNSGTNVALLARRAQ